MRKNSLRSLVFTFFSFFLFFLFFCCCCSSSTVSAEIQVPLLFDLSDYSPSARACLYVASGLPACPFERYKRSTETTRKEADSDKNLVLFARKRWNDTWRMEQAKYSERHVTVYVLERCLPSRLPFKMTPCDSKDVLKTANEVWKLFPFKIGGLAEAPLVFPRLNRISSSDGATVRPLIREGEEREESAEREEKSLLHRFSRDRRETKSSSSGGGGGGVSSPRGYRRKARNVEVGSEFPYWKAIPYDPKKLGFADSGSSTFAHRVRKLRDVLRGRKFSVEEDGTGIANETGGKEERQILQRLRRGEKRKRQKKQWHEEDRWEEKAEEAEEAVEEEEGKLLSEHLCTLEMTSGEGRRNTAK